MIVPEGRAYEVVPGGKTFTLYSIDTCWETQNGPTMVDTLSLTLESFKSFTVFF